MFCEQALKISQKVLIGITQFYRYALQYVGVSNDLPSKNLGNQKKETFLTKINIFCFTIITKHMLPMLIQLTIVC